MNLPLLYSPVRFFRQTIRQVTMKKGIKQRHKDAKEERGDA